MKLKKILAGVLASALAATALVMPTSAEGAATDIKVTFTITGIADQDATYNAGLIFQTESWAYRNTLDDKVIQFGGSLTVENPTTSFVDATIKGDGSYTVELKDLPEDGNAWHSLGILTDIPVNDDLNVEVTAVEGATLNADNKPSFEGDEFFKVNLINEWNDGVKDAPVISLPAPAATVTTSEEATVTTSEEAAVTTSAEAAATTAAAGNVNQGTDDKNSPDTGVEGVAVVAGLAVIAAGAVIVAKKRK